MIDVDFFKEINDRFGHSAGDQALLRIVRRSRNTVRRSDRVGRYGGTRSSSSCRDCDTDRIRKIAERLRRAVSARAMTCDGRKLKATISLGCAVAVQTADVKSIIRRADAALLSAKGRDETVS